MGKEGEMSLKKKVDADEALPVARNLLNILSPFCERCEIVGSLRRRRGFVGDVELLYIPKFRLVAADLFSAKASKMANMADGLIDKLLADGVLNYRQNCDGHTNWGELNKYAVHKASGLSIDLFSTTELCWWNALVMRTGGKQNNLNITSAARRLGWTFEAYGSGFRSLRGLPYHHTTSEQDVYEHVRLPYLAPENRP